MRPAQKRLAQAAAKLAVRGVAMGRDLGREWWTGPVERRDPASYQRPSLILTWFCARCRSWTMNGAYRYNRCNWCGTHRPDSRAAQAAHAFGIAELATRDSSWGEKPAS